jgi:hypothetical protein
LLAEQFKVHVGQGILDPAVHIHVLVHLITQLQLHQRVRGGEQDAVGIGDAGPMRVQMLEDGMTITRLRLNLLRLVNVEVEVSRANVSHSAEHLHELACRIRAADGIGHDAVEMRCRLSRDRIQWIVIDRRTDGRSEDDHIVVQPQLGAVSHCAFVGIGAVLVVHFHAQTGELGTNLAVQRQRFPT